MSLPHLLKYGLSLPPHVAAKKALKMGWRIANGYVSQVKEYRAETFAPLIEADHAPMHRYISDLTVEPLHSFAGEIFDAAEMYLAHRFDLLGSGWVKVCYGMKAPGVEGVVYPPKRAPLNLASNLSPGNRKRAKVIRGLISQTYQPIDWQIDFKSGHRWSEAEWSGTIRYGHVLGVDVKVPWELSRLQHLTYLAYAFALSNKAEGNQNWRPAEVYRREFCDQVLDFIAANPPRFGVNWSCTMDVAIRAANLVLARDLFLAFGATFEADFEREFQSAIWAHGRHIASHLEWHDIHRANHYLADICGLVFVASYLPSTPESDIWLAFGVSQFKGECELQFTPDGANFEASTGYHRLSAEMVAYTTALICALGNDKNACLQNYNHNDWTAHPPLTPAPIAFHQVQGFATPVALGESHFALMRKMARFSMDVTKPCGTIVQIGDNDSGRFFKNRAIFERLSPEQAKARYANLEGYQPEEDDKVFLDENQLDHRGLVGAFNGFFDDPRMGDFSGSVGVIETALIKNLSALSSSIALDTSTQCQASRYSGNVTSLDVPSTARKIVISLADLEGLQAIAYEDFGLFIWKNAKHFISFRAGPIGQNGNGGHAHHDQLSIELQVDGEDWITDPGTCLYTPVPALREAYRSVLCHSAPQLHGQEPVAFNAGLFRMVDSAKATVLSYGPDHILASHQGFGLTCKRLMKLVPNGLEISDWFEGGDAKIDLQAQSLVLSDKKSVQEIFPVSLGFSPGYGKRHRLR